MQYWLMKSEPDSFSIDDLKNSPNQVTHWDGVRNYQARNFMMQQMQVGDVVLFYHSNITEPAIVGLAEVYSPAYPDHTAFDADSKYYDPRSTSFNPRWYMVEVKFKEKFAQAITLKTLKTYPELANMQLLKKGNRLSIMPVSNQDFAFILTLATLSK